MRDYLSVQEASKIIILEVMDTGISKSWNAVENNTLDLAKNLESYLAKFNIGMSSNNSNTWIHRPGGTRFFANKMLAKAATNKFNNLIKSVIKK